MKYVKIIQNNKARFMKVDSETKVEKLAIVILYDKDNKNLIEAVSIKQNVSHGVYHYYGEQYGTEISLMEFEDYLKKAMSHLIRQVPGSDLRVFRESTIKDKLDLVYYYGDEPEIELK